MSRGITTSSSIRHYAERHKIQTVIPWYFVPQVTPMELSGYDP